MMEINTLESQLLPALPEDIADCIDVLMTLPRQLTADGGGVAIGFRFALEGCPEWAVRDALAMWMRKECPSEENPNFGWAPTPPTFRGLVDWNTRKHRQALEGLQAALKLADQPQEPPPEPGYVGGDAVDEILGKWRAKSKRDPAPEVTAARWSPPEGASHALKETYQRKRGKS